MSSIPDPIVELAVEQLRAYGEHVAYQPLTRGDAERLLPFWSHYREMTADDVAAALDRFGPPEPGVFVEQPSQHHPAWCDGRHALLAGHERFLADEPVEYTSVRVTLFEFARPVVLVRLRLAGVDEDVVELADADEEHTELQLHPDAARRLARRLLEAADMLQPGHGWISGPMGGAS